MDSWDYEIFLDEINYQPQKNNYFDVWVYEGEDEPTIDEGNLDGDSLNDYFLRTTRDKGDRRFISGLKLIYSFIDSDEPGVDFSDKTVFWSRHDFIKIVETFSLPKRFTQMIGRCHCVFSTCEPDNLAVKSTAYAYIFSTLFHHYPFWSVTASWDREKNITYALLHCTSDASEQSILRLKRYISKMATLAMHPILVPVLIMDLETNLTLRDDEAWTSVLRQVEKETRQEPNEERRIDPFELDLPSIVQRLNGCSVFLSLIERESETVLTHLDHARRIVSELQCARLNTPNRLLNRHIEFLIEARRNLLLRLQNVQHRSQTQLQFTYNFLAQRDNKLNIEVARDSKLIALSGSRDSMSMKTIALLTIAFLPGTFVASFFAIPLFDWQASTKWEIAGPYFWLYWAIAIPLTLLVLGSWAIWIRIKLKKQAKEDNEIRDSF